MLFIVSLRLFCPYSSNTINNNLQIPLQVLKTKSKIAWSGCIEVEEPKDASVSWKVYFLEGKVQYISSTDGQQTRLDYLWQKFKLGSRSPNLNEIETSEYELLCQHLSNKQLIDLDLKKYLFRFTREGFAHVASIKQAKILSNPAKRITKPLVCFSLEQLWSKQEEQIKFWRQARTYLASPFSRLYLEQKNALQFYKAWKVLYHDRELAPLAESQKLSFFASLFVAKQNLYEIATKTHVDTQFLAKHLKSSIQENLLASLPFKELSDRESNQKYQTLENKLPN